MEPMPGNIFDSTTRIGDDSCDLRQWFVQKAEAEHIC